MLAHEVKNPLSGIRGAAQLLEESASDSERELTTLICEETDRIVALVDRMEAFEDGRPIDRAALNIHQVLNHVRAVCRRTASARTYASWKATIRRCRKCSEIATNSFRYSSTS